MTARAYSRRPESRRVRAHRLRKELESYESMGDAELRAVQARAREEIAANRQRAQVVAALIGRVAE